uniref:Uncharacterized protein n=1 Tax=Rhizophora mucronata TaxID=61149 RepID=A0A2P2J584_RHIMU
MTKSAPIHQPVCTTCMASQWQPCAWNVTSTTTISSDQNLLRLEKAGGMLKLER